MKNVEDVKLLNLLENLFPFMPETPVLKAKDCLDFSIF
jgi:hypothetical protein